MADLIDIKLLERTEIEVRAQVPVTDRLKQPLGLVHGGVYATIVETLASSGAALSAMARGQTTVGLENSTSFLRAMRSGTLIGTARPLHRGRTTQVWEVDITDDQGRLCALVRTTVYPEPAEGP